MTARLGIRLDPLDVLFFRGGRPFDAANRVEGELPNPQTLAGALRTALLARHAPADLFRKLGRTGDMARRLRDAGAPEWILSARFRGPWLALVEKGGNTTEPLVTAPAILYKDDERNTIHRNHPLDAGKLPGWNPPDGRLPLWRSDGPDAKIVGGYLTPAGLRTFLEGKKPAPEQIVRPGALFDFDHRTGIGIAPDSFTTEVGQIYGIKLLALKPETELAGKRYRVCFYAEILLGPGAPAGDVLAGPLPFGGEGRYVTLQPVTPYTWPEAPASGDRCLWLMISPGIFAANRPDVPDAPGLGTLRAAASASPMAVSGWNVHANGPHPTRFAVPAGAVYFVQGSTSLTQGSLCADTERVAQGWGFALRGVW
jgi:CRISPR-associated protein Cmr3